MAIVNLDLKAAQAGQNIVERLANRQQQEREKVEGVLRKTLGITLENGPYAATLYLLTRKKEEAPAADACRSELLRLARFVSGSTANTDAPSQCLKFLSDHICSDLNRLLLTKQLWEQALIYGRYTAQSRGW